ncbi:hypothetical protein FW481_08635 [Campylobacter coli]|nr:hypothetical protein [Campylobacter coli]
MYLTKEEFFKRDLPAKSYYYSHGDQIFEISSQQVINSIQNGEKNIQRCFYIMDNLNATDEFILNDFLHGFADEIMEGHIRYELRQMIEEKVLNGESVKFHLKGDDGEVREYIAYRDDEGAYHVHESDQSYETQGWKRFSNFTQSLVSYFKESVFDDFQRVDESEINK